MCAISANSVYRQLILFSILVPLFRCKDISSLLIREVKFTYTLRSVSRLLHSKVLVEETFIK